MKEYIKKLISSSNDADEKRVISLISLLVLIIMVGLKAAKMDIDIHLIYVFASLTGGSSVLTVIDKFTEK